MNKGIKIKKSELLENYDFEYNNVLDYAAGTYIKYEDMEEAASVFLAHKMGVDEDIIREHIRYIDLKQVEHYLDCCGDVINLKDYKDNEYIELDIEALEEFKLDNEQIILNNETCKPY